MSGGIVRGTGCTVVLVHKVHCRKTIMKKKAHDNYNTFFRMNIANWHHNSINWVVVMEGTRHYDIHGENTCSFYALLCFQC